jgi:hypothetical protein
MHEQPQSHQSRGETEKYTKIFNHNCQERFANTRETSAAVFPRPYGRMHKGLSQDLAHEIDECTKNPSHGICQAGITNPRKPSVITFRTRDWREHEKRPSQHLTGEIDRNFRYSICQFRLTKTSVTEFARWDWQNLPSRHLPGEIDKSSVIAFARWDWQKT